MSTSPDKEKNAAPVVKHNPIKIISAWWGDLAFAASVFLLLIYGIAVAILNYFDVNAAPWSLQLVINALLFLWGAMGFVIVLRGEYRDRHKGVRRGFPAYLHGGTLLLITWLPLMVMLVSTFFKK